MKHTKKNIGTTTSRIDVLSHEYNTVLGISSFQINVGGMLADTIWAVTIKNYPEWNGPISSPDGITDEERIENVSNFGNT